MAQRLALVPPELISGYHQFQSPLIRLGQEIDFMLEREKLPDDMKAKLLGELIVKYHKTVHTPPEPIRVTTVGNDEEMRRNDDNTEAETDHDDILRNVIESVPVKFAKFVPLIIERLKKNEYGWNENGELTSAGVTLKNSSIADFFSYIFRNLKTHPEPEHFKVFLKALKEVNIPLSWIKNKKVLSSSRKNILNEGDSLNTAKEVGTSTSIPAVHLDEDESSISDTEVKAFWPPPRVARYIYAHRISLLQQVQKENSLENGKALRKNIL